MLLKGGAGFFEVAVFVFLQSRLGLRAWAESQNQGDNCRCTAAAVSRQEGKHETGRRCGKRPLVAFDRLTGGENPGLAEFHRLDAFLKNLASRFRADEREKTTRGGCNFLQSGFVQFRCDRLASGIPHKIRASVIEADRNQRSLGRSNANCKNTNPLGRRLFGGRDAIRVEFLAVGQNDERAGLSLGLSKSLPRGCDGRRHVGAAFGYDGGVQLVEGIGDCVVVERERGLQKGRAGKGNESDAIALQKADEVLSEKFRPSETRGRHVRRQHAARGVDRHDDIAAFLFRFFFQKSVLRLGQSHDGQSDGCQKQRSAQYAAQWTHGAGELIPQTHCDDFGNKSLAAPVGPHKESRHQRQYQ